MMYGYNGYLYGNAVKSKVPEVNERLPAHLRPPDLVSNPWDTPSSGLIKDVLFVAEFSELEGPKPVVIYPAKGYGSFDVGQYAVKVMAVDYHSNHHSQVTFSLSSDVHIMLTDHAQRVYTLVYSFTLYDINARGFVRPHCIVYATSDPRKLEFIHEGLVSRLREVVSQTKEGNRDIFAAALQQRYIDLVHSQELYCSALSNPSESLVVAIEKSLTDVKDALKCIAPTLNFEKMDGSAEAPLVSQQLDKSFLLTKKMDCPLSPIQDLTRDFDNIISQSLTDIRNMFCRDSLVLLKEQRNLKFINPKATAVHIGPTITANLMLGSAYSQTRATSHRLSSSSQETCVSAFSTLELDIEKSGSHSASAGVPRSNFTSVGESPPIAIGQSGALTASQSDATLTNHSVSSIAAESGFLLSDQLDGSGRCGHSLTDESCAGPADQSDPVVVRAADQPQSLLTVGGEEWHVGRNTGVPPAVHRAAHVSDGRDVTGHDTRDVTGHDTRDVTGHDTRDVTGHDMRDVTGHDTRDVTGHDTRQAWDTGQRPASRQHSNHTWGSASLGSRELHSADFLSSVDSSSSPSRCDSTYGSAHSFRKGMLLGKSSKSDADVDQKLKVCLSRYHALFPHLVYSVLTGRPLIVIPNMKADKPYDDLEDVLAVCSLFTSFLHPPKYEEKICLVDVVKYPLIGYVCKGKEKPREEAISSAVRPLLSIFNLHTRQLTAPAYKGQWLGIFSKRRLRRLHPRVLLARVESLLSEISMRAYMYYHGVVSSQKAGHLPCDQVAFQAKCDAHFKEAGIAAHDRTIVEYLTETVQLEQSLENLQHLTSNESLSPPSRRIDSNTKCAVFRA